MPTSSISITLPRSVTQGWTLTYACRVYCRERIDELSAQSSAPDGAHGARAEAADLRGRNGDATTPCPQFSRRFHPLSRSRRVRGWQERQYPRLRALAALGLGPGQLGPAELAVGES